MRRSQAARNRGRRRCRCRGCAAITGLLQCRRRARRPARPAGCSRLRFHRAAQLLELRDVGAGNEGLLAVARAHDQAHRRVGVELREHLRHRPPHVVAHGVIFGGLEKRTVRDRAVDRGFQFRPSCHLFRSFLCSCNSSTSRFVENPARAGPRRVCSPRSGVARDQLRRRARQLHRLVDEVSSPSLRLLHRGRGACMCFTCGSANTWSMR